LVQCIHSEEYQKAFGQTYISIELVEQAKAMEKEQIKNAYILPLSSEYWFKDEDFFQTESEQYYNQNYES
jgi:N-acetylglutamate synthase-like GNAT family acetyltransferase